MEFLNKHYAFYMLGEGQSPSLDPTPVG